jgi:hypothetical protein
MPDGASSPARECPLLSSVVADRWPGSASRLYCRQAEGRRLAPAEITVACICSTPAYLCCPEFLRRASVVTYWAARARPLHARGRR